MKYKYCTAVLIFLLMGVAHAAELKKSIGLGFQYGLLGGQLSLSSSLGKSRVSLGLGAVTAGHEFVFKQRYTIGVQAFKWLVVTETVGAGLVANYYLNTVEEKGWLVGVETSWYEDDVLLTDGEKAKRINRTFLSVGYTF